MQSLYQIKGHPTLQLDIYIIFDGGDYALLLLILMPRDCNLTLLLISLDAATALSGQHKAMVNASRAY